MENKENDNLVFYGSLVGGCVLVYPMLRMFFEVKLDIIFPSMGKTLEATIFFFFSWLFLMFIGLMCRRRDQKKLKVLGVILQVLGFAWLLALVWIFSRGIW